ncbi:MAG: protein phosphatase 2C domain-containing protein [Candidatus Methanomethylophilaceae archaeon]|nr:protein phosphatase 2C domain-containing protein [Candidatus Methanomethylophilaceae archaeon]
MPGKSHYACGLPCQDSSGCISDEWFSAAAVSDGHGGSRYFRSNVGSRIAVDCALEAVREI